MQLHRPTAEGTSPGTSASLVARRGVPFKPPEASHVLLQPFFGHRGLVDSVVSSLRAAECEEAGQEVQRTCAANARFDTCHASRVVQMPSTGISNGIQEGGAGDFDLQGISKFPRLPQTSFPSRLGAKPGRTDDVTPRNRVAARHRSNDRPPSSRLLLLSQLSLSTPPTSTMSKFAVTPTQAICKTDTVGFVGFVSWHRSAA